MSVSVFSRPLPNTNVKPSSEGPSSEDQALYLWCSKNQSKNSTGLLSSYPEEEGTGDQAFTYDQALAGILFLKHKDINSAKKIFDFFSSEWNKEGFWTVYNAKTKQGSQIEYIKIMGPTAWMARFFLHYYSHTHDPKALSLAMEITNYIQGLSHKENLIAMGEGDPWNNVYSTENNLDFFALFQGLLKTPLNPSDISWIQKEQETLKNGFLTKAYDQTTKLFKRGLLDPTQSLDTNAWAILVFGPTLLKDFFNIDLSDFIIRTEKTFLTQPTGRFGGDVLTSKGFDFSDQRNAYQCTHKGIQWVEGTSHMIVAYKLLKEHYSNIQDPIKAKECEEKATHLSNSNSKLKIIQNNETAYPYTDNPGAKIWWDSPDWRASKGPSLASTAWMYFALMGINPFIL